MDAKALNSFGLLFYNTIYSFPVLLLFMLMKSDELAQSLAFPEWSNGSFIAAFIMASVMGTILNYSIFVCTGVNSPLTTTVVGSLKNVLTAYLGILGLGGDYVFSWSNFAGLNLSIIGSLMYSYFKYVESNAPKHAGKGDREELRHDRDTKRAAANEV